MARTPKHDIPFRDGLWWRACPNCKKEIGSKSRNGVYSAIEKGRLCAPCGHANRATKYDIPLKDGKWWRVCPKCGSNVGHTTRGGAHSGIRDGRLCSDCGRECLPDHSGENNPFYGKRHSLETRAKLAAVDKSYAQTDDFRLKMRETMKKRIADGEVRLSNYEYDVIRYGEEVAEEKRVAAALKKSAAASGENNPMYGKPSPAGSGNGWSGWLSGRYFRSLLELNFMLHNPSYESAETEEFRAAYEWLGKSRTTTADFVNREERHLVECKPLSLHFAPNVVARCGALRELCDGIGYKFEIVDPGKPDRSTILTLFEDGELMWLPRYEEKFKKWLC